MEISELFEIVSILASSPSSDPTIAATILLVSFWEVIQWNHQDHLLWREWVYGKIGVNTWEAIK